MPSGTISVGGVTATIYFGEAGDAGVVESIAEGEGPKASATFVCPYGQRYDFLKGLAGSSTGGPGGIVRTVPFAYPPSPNLYCTGVSSITGIGWKWDAGLGWPTATDARIVATFGIPRWSFESGSSSTDPSGQPWTTTRFRLTAEFQSPTYGGTFQWTEGGPQDGKPVPGSAASRILPHAEISISRHWMPYIPIDEAMTFLGSVNVDPIILGNHTFEEQKVLFAGMNATETADTLGNRVYECEYILLGNKHQTWNDVMQSDGLFYNVNTQADGSGSNPYPLLDFWHGMP